MLTNDTALPLGNVLLDPLEHGRLGIQVVHRDVEEALNLRGVQVHRDDMIGARHREHVGHQLGADWSARFVLLVLAGVRKARNDGRHTRSRSNLAGVDHDQQLHQIVVHLATARLDDVNILATHRFANLHAKKHVNITNPF